MAPDPRRPGPKSNVLSGLGQTAPVSVTMPSPPLVNAMALLNVLILAVAGAIASEVAEEPGTVPDYVAPVSAESSFNPLPELWGLRELSQDTSLGDVDQSFVFYLSERAIFRIGGKDGRVFLGGGRQVATKGELSESGIAEYLRWHSCLCALEYEASSSPLQLQTAAGAYRLAAAPSLTEDDSGMQRIELKFAEKGEAGQARLRGLICWTSGDTIAPLARSLPRFAMLADKGHPGFADPPRDDRPIREHEIGRPMARSFRVALTDEFAVSATERFLIESWVQVDLDAPELTGVARPGLTTLLREVQSGRKVPIDHSDYFRDLDPCTRSLDRQQGIHYRDPTYWP